MATRPTPTSFFEIWFPKNTQNITIVAPPSSDGLRDAELTSSNYALLDRLGDRDSIYSLGKLLSRRYPNAVIHLVSSEDFSQQTLSRNFVVLGGPGAPVPSSTAGKVEATDGNEACRTFSERLGSHFSYTADCEHLIVGGRKFTSSYDSRGHMVKDYGVFSAFPNPHLRSTRIVMLHGIHTLGVLGSTRIFDGDLDSHGNFVILHEALGGQSAGVGSAFECFFEVDVMHGEVECPAVKTNQVFALERQKSEVSVSDLGKNSKAADFRTISAEDLKKEAMALIRVAEQQTIVSNRTLIQDLRERLSSVKQPSLSSMQKVLDVCRRNSRIPPESVVEITGILDNDGL